MSDHTQKEVSVEVGGSNLQESVSQARDAVREQQAEALTAQQEAQQLEQQLLEAQLAEQQKKEAVEKGKETAEQMNETTGE